MALQIRGVHHIVLTVSDPNRSAEFYEKILGVKSASSLDLLWKFSIVFSAPAKTGNSQ